MRNLRRSGQRRGFTLIELLVVVSVMLVLMGLLVAGAAQLRITAMREGSKAICNQFVIALDTYQNSYRAYPYVYPSGVYGTASVGDLSSSAAFSGLYWDGSSNFWKPEAANATVIYQLLQPVGLGPFVDPSNANIPLKLPKNSSKQPVTLQVGSNNVTLRVAVDKFDNPLNVTWTGNATMYQQGDKPKWGYWERTGANYTLTTHDEVLTFAPGDLSSSPARVMLEVTGLRVWSSGPDGILHTADDIEASVAGR